MAPTPRGFLNNATATFSYTGLRKRGNPRRKRIAAGYNLKSLGQQIWPASPVYSAGAGITLPGRNLHPSPCATTIAISESPPDSAYRQGFSRHCGPRLQPGGCSVLAVVGATAPANAMGPPRLLLVEDEPALADLLKKYLERLGYKVDACALRPMPRWRFLDAHPEDYALLITDLSLPDMSGDELMTRSRLRAPHLRAIIASGYPVRTLASRACRVLAEAFLA